MSSYKSVEEEFRTFFLLACCREYDDSNIEDGIEIIGIIYDAHPEALDVDIFTELFQLPNTHEQVQTFINRELVYARQARLLSAIQSSYGYFDTLLF